MQTVIFWK